MELGEENLLCRGINLVPRTDNFHVCPLILTPLDDDPLDGLPRPLEDLALMFCPLVIKLHSHDIVHQIWIVHEDLIVGLHVTQDFFPVDVDENGFPWRNIHI